MAYPNKNNRSGNPMHRSGIDPRTGRPYGESGKGPRGNPNVGRRGGGGGMNIGAWAQAQADKYIAAQIAAIQESQRLYTDELNKAAQERVKQGQALASWMQGMNFPGRVQGIYQTAGNDITGYAGGFGGEMRNIANADAADMTNMVSGTGQEGAVRNEGQGMSDVLYGAYGWSPAKKFAETGAAYGADAALQPSFAAQFAQAEAIKMQQEGMGALKDFALKMAEARAGKMDMVEKFKGLRSAEEDKAFDRRMQMLKFQSDQHYKRYLILREEGKMDLANREFRLAQQKADQAAREQNRQYQLDVRREDRLSKPGAAGPRLSPEQKKNAMAGVQALVDPEENVLNRDIQTAIKNGEWFVGVGPPVPGARKRLAEKLYQQYKYLTMGSGPAQARLRKLIQQALDAALRAGQSGQAAPAGGSPGSSGSSYEDYR